MSYDADVIKWRKSYGFRQSTAVGTAAPGFEPTHYTADGYHYITKLSVNKAFPAIVGGTNLGLGLLAYTFPTGVQLVKFAGINIGLTQTEGNVNADTPDLGLGTVIAVGAVATLTTGTWEDILTGQAMNNCTGTKEVISLVVPDAGIVSATGDFKTMYLNIADGWAASGDVALLASGEIWIDWVRFG